MKYLKLLLFSLLFTACGSSKKAIEKAEITKEVLIENEVKTEVKAESIEEVNIVDFKRKKDTIYVVDIAFNSIHSKWASLITKHVSDEGNVDYKGFKNDRTKLNSYIEITTEKQPQNDWPREEKLAYWINIYNALTIDLILRHYPVKSIKEIDKPWDQRLWKFGDKWLNLNDIEHNILRKMEEPRIHFAIVCASVSCPKLKNTAFTASNLDVQLTEATEQFLADKDRNVITKDRLQLSKIFKWFKKDFEQDGSLIDFINQYTEIDISSKAKKSYRDYNWDLND